MVELHALGAMNLTSGGRCLLDRISQDKRLALLNYLALEGREGPLRREKVLGVFWPERPEARARNLLSQGLCHLRKALGPDVVLSHGGGGVRLDPEKLWCDAVAFEQMLGLGRLELALDVYGGPLLEGFLPNGLHEFLDWVDRERRRLSDLARQAALDLSLRAARDPDETETAVAWARWALRQAPFDEAVLRHLVRLLADSGRSAEALWTYRRFRSRLRDDLDLDPDPSTEALVRAIRGEGDGRLLA
ncbi:MAG: BTAD domain-containing putative transcriptional regulator [Gemmatimonadota bacterium]